MDRAQYILRVERPNHARQSPLSQFLTPWRAYVPGVLLDCFSPFSSALFGGGILQGTVQSSRGCFRAVHVHEVQLGTPMPCCLRCPHAHAPAACARRPRPLALLRLHCRVLDSRKSDTSDLSWGPCKLL